MNLRVHYDEEADVLYLAREGQEEEVVEVSPGVNLEFDTNRELIGVEILKASQVLKEFSEKGGGMRRPGQEALPDKMAEILHSLREILLQRGASLYGDRPEALPSTGETLLREWFRDWEHVTGDAVNVIPGGTPGRCHDVLLVFCWGRDSLDRRLWEAAEHAGERCPGANKWVIVLSDKWTAWDWRCHASAFRVLNRVYGVRVFRVMLDEPSMTPVPLV